MEHRYTLVGKIVCKWLGLHWPNYRRIWEFEGKHAVCKICGQVLTKNGRRWE